METGLAATPGPGGLTALVELLRDAGFRAGPAEAIAAARLLQRLQARPDAPADAQGWRLWLRPVFCSNREEQQRFDSLFTEWAGRVQQRRVPSGTQTTVDPPPPPPPVPPWWVAWRPHLLAALALVAAGLLFVLFGPPERRPAERPSAPARSASAPAVPASGTPFAAPASAAGPRATGYLPMWRTARTLRPEVVLPLCVLPLLLGWLLGGAPPLALLRGQRRSARSVALNTSALEAQARALLPALEPGVSGRLERHIRTDSDGGAPLSRRRRVDERRTVEALLRQPGRVELQYRAAPLRPSYLVLVDAHDEADPRGRLFVHWAERLRHQGLAVEIRTFRHAASEAAAPASHSLNWRPGEPALPLDELADPPAGQRLVVVGDAAAWVLPDGTWRPWYRRARLHRWAERAFFTPTELRDWGDREAAVEIAEHSADPGFLMLPMDESALEAWSVLVASGHLPAFSLSEPQRYPRLLSREAIDPYAEPELAEREQLVAQLMLYLGDAGFRWLCMLAVPPLVRWELTLLLGQALFEHAPGVAPHEAPAVFSRAYRRLARLPWLRGGSLPDGSPRSPGLPDWLRLRLLDELPPAAAADVRDRVDALLSRLHEGPGTLALGFEAPPGKDDPAATGAAGAAPDGRGDALYLGLLSGLTPRQLAQRVPDPWRAWLRPRRPAAGTGWRARWRRSAADARDWVQARWSLLAFKDGLPWAERNPGAWLVGVVAAGIAAVWLATVASSGPGSLPPMVEALLFSTEAVPVEVPLAKGAKMGAIAPDGRTAALLGRDGRIHVADMETGRVLRSFSDGGFSQSIDFDGQRISACNSPRERVWSLDGAPLSEHSRGFCGLQALQARNASAGGLRATGDAKGRVTLVQPPAGDPNGTPRAETPVALSTAAIVSLSLSGDGRRLLAVDGDGRVRVASQWQEPLGTAAMPTAAAAVSDDGRTVALLSATGRLEVGSADGGATPIAMPAPAQSVHVTLAPDGRSLALRTRVGRVWLGAPGAALEERSLSEPALAVAYTGDGRLLAVSAEGTISQWATGGWQRVDTLGPTFKSLTTAMIHRNGSVAGIAPLEGQEFEVLWRTAEGALGRVVQSPAPGAPDPGPRWGSQGRSLSWQASGSPLVARFGDAQTPVYPRSGAEPARLVAYDDGTGRWAELVGGTLRILDASGVEAGRTESAAEVVDATALPDGRWLVRDRAGRVDLLSADLRRQAPPMADVDSNALTVLAGNGRLLLTAGDFLVPVPGAGAGSVRLSLPARWWALPPADTTPAWQPPPGARPAWHPVLLLPAMALLLGVLALLQRQRLRRLLGRHVQVA